MAYGRPKRSNYLKIVAENETGFAAAVSDPARREQVQELTEQLIDALIEMIDLTDGDPDAEPSSDDFDDDHVL